MKIDYDLDQIRSEVETYLFYESGKFRFSLIHKHTDSNLYKLYTQVKEAYPNLINNEIIYRLYHNMLDEQTLCPICGKPRPFSGRFSKKETEYSRTCCKECDRKYRSLHAQDWVKKVKATNLKLYGNESTAQLDFVIKKKRETSLEKYGVTHHMQLKSQRDKVAATTLANHGIDNMFKSEKNKVLRLEGRNKAYYTRFKNYLLTKCKLELDETKGYEWLGHGTDETDYIYPATCLVCGAKTMVSPYFCRCMKCRPFYGNVSSEELSLLHFIKENYKGLVYTNTTQLIKPYEIDIYIPDLNLAFEINGEYHHSERSKDFDYHYAKTQRCLNQGVDLIHIWTQDYLYKQDIIHSMVLNKLKLIQNKIYARNCIIKPLELFEYDMFMQENHLHGKGRKPSIRLGLYHKDELVSVLGLISRSNGALEIARFASKLYTNVIGAFGKLIKPYLNTKLFTYADADWTPDWGKSVYSKIFDYKGETDIQWCYYNINTKYVYPREYYYNKEVPKDIVKIYKNVNHKFTLNMKEANLED